MPWFNVDDSFHSHPKVLATEPAALGLWVVAGSWSNANLTEGFVPDYVLPRLLPDSAMLAEALVTAGLWKRARGGFKYHDWTDWNATRAVVKARRAANARRQALFRDPSLKHAVRERDGDTCRYCGTLVRWGSGRAPDSGTYDHVDPAGDNTFENLVVACVTCNSRKSTKTLAQAGMTLRNPPERNASSNASRNASAQASVQAFQSNPSQSVVDVINRVADRYARLPDDDPILRTIIDCLRERTGHTVSADHARLVATQVLRGRRPTDPCAYLRKSITSEPHPAARFLPPAGIPPSPPWCGKCDERTRQRDRDDGAVIRCPDCHPLAERRPAS